jgi:hypothetical protein
LNRYTNNISVQVKRLDNQIGGKKSFVRVTAFNCEAISVNSYFVKQRIRNVTIFGDYAGYEPDVFSRLLRRQKLENNELIVLFKFSTFLNLGKI